MKKLINIKETLDKQSTQIPNIESSETKQPNSPASKRQQIHDYLKLGFGLTRLDCSMMFGYINLGDYIYVLRKKYGNDYIINKKLRNYKTGAKYVSYMINEKYL